MHSISKAALPNYLCIARIALIVPLFLAWHVLPKETAYLVITGLFLLAAFTDWLDGFLARKWAVQSPLGAMLDQIADKLLMVTILAILAMDNLLPLLLVLLIILREIWVSGLREYAGTQGLSVPVSKLGKLKTATQMIGVAAVLIVLSVYMVLPKTEENLKMFVLIFGFARATLWAAMCLGWLSAWQYSRVLWKPTASAQ